LMPLETPTGWQQQLECCPWEPVSSMYDAMNTEEALKSLYALFAYHHLPVDTGKSNYRSQCHRFLGSCHDCSQRR
jgi:hypothetical protein